MLNESLPPWQTLTWDFAEIDRRLSPILDKYGRDSVAIYLGVILAVIFAFTAPFDRGRYTVGRWFRRAAVTSVKLNPLWDFRVSGIRPSDPRHPYVAVSNHESLADIFLMASIFWWLVLLRPEFFRDNALPINGAGINASFAVHQDVNGKARAIVDAVSGAGLVAKPGDVGQRAPLVLLVLGTDAGDEGSDAILAGLVQGLAAQATGVVVAGSTADGGSGQLGRLRADPAGAGVASVDGIDTSAGRVATILTLQRSLTTPGGSFGASGADGAVPLGEDKSP